MNRSSRRAGRSATLVAALIVLVLLIPVIWTVETSLKTNAGVWSLPPQWLFQPSFENYRTVLFDRGFATYVWHSAVIAAGSTAIALVLGSLAAYGFERFRFRGRRILFFAFLFAFMVPEMSIALPSYLLSIQLHLYDTYWLLIAMHATFSTAFATWMLRGFIADVPYQVEECAMLDGCNRLQAFRHVVLPLIGPGLVATAVFCLIFSWNNFPYALALSSLNTETLPVAIGQLKTPSDTAWGQIMAVTVIAFTPTMVFAFIVQKWLVRGLSLGSTQ